MQNQLYYIMEYAVYIIIVQNSINKHTHTHVYVITYTYTVSFYIYIYLSKCLHLTHDINSILDIIRCKAALSSVFDAPLLHILCGDFLSAVKYSATTDLAPDFVPTGSSCTCTASDCTIYISHSVCNLSMMYLFTLFTNLSASVQLSKQSPVLFRTRTRFFLEAWFAQEIYGLTPNPHGEIHMLWFLDTLTLTPVECIVLGYP